MKHSFVITLFLALCAASASPAGARTTEPDLDAVDAYIAETMRRLPINGLALAIVKGDEILYQQGYGTANAAGAPATPQTPFMLASVTKTFTALAIQQLAADGRLDLDAPLQTYLPEFALAEAKSAEGITLRHLLDHTSGIATLEGTQPYLHHPATTFEQGLARLAHYVPQSAPGAREEYSNWNYVLLGEVIARASGQPYAAYMQTHVLAPLEMAHASFDDYHTLPGAATGNLIVFGARVPYDEKHIPIMLSAGYLTASAEDIAHYLIPYFNQGQYRGRTVLPAEGPGWYDVTWNWHTSYPGASASGFAGAHNSINTAIQLFPLQRVGVVVLMNTRLDATVPGPTAGQIAINLGRMTLGQSYELPSNRQFYGGHALVDGLLLVLAAGLVWQIARLRGWTARYRKATQRGRLAAGMGIALNVLVAASLLALPGLLGTRWHIVLYHRPDTAVPILAAGLLLAALGLTKVILVIRSSAASPTPIAVGRATETVRTAP